MLGAIRKDNVNFHTIFLRKMLKLKIVGRQSSPIRGWAQSISLKTLKSNPVVQILCPTEEICYSRSLWAVFAPVVGAHEPGGMRPHLIFWCVYLSKIRNFESGLFRVPLTVSHSKVIRMIISKLFHDDLNVFWLKKFRKINFVYSTGTKSINYSRTFLMTSSTVT